MESPKAGTGAMEESIGTHDSTKVLAIMLPRPRAAPVTRQTLPSIEKDARVRLLCRPKSPRCISWPGCLSTHFYIISRVNTDTKKRTGIRDPLKQRKHAWPRFHNKILGSRRPTWIVWIEKLTSGCSNVKLSSTAAILGSISTRCSS